MIREETLERLEELRVLARDSDQEDERYLGLILAVVKEVIHQESIGDFSDLCFDFLRSDRIARKRRYGKTDDYTLRGRRNR